MGETIWHTMEEAIRPNEGVLCLIETKDISDGIYALGYWHEEDDGFFTVGGFSYKAEDIERFCLVNEIL